MNRVAGASPNPSAGPAFVGPLGALAFLVLTSYGAIRPAAESLFLSAYSSRMLPAAWLVVTLTATLVVTVYNRLAATTGLIRLFLFCTAASTAIMLVLLLCVALHLPGGVFALYVWKDVYIVILVEIFWSLANVLSAQGTARWAYGLFCVMGSLGDIAGSLGGGALAGRMGTRAALWLVVPVLGLCWLGGALVGRAVGAGVTRARDQAPRKIAGSLGVVRRSAYLGPLLCVVALVQIVITLIDFQYSTMLARAYPDTDVRTTVISNVYVAIEVGSISLQLLTGPILRLLGVSGTLLSIPLLLLTIAAGVVATPRFVALLLARVVSKCLDYSIFRAAKEMLYIPLGYAEKTQGKALVDMLTYRVAKGGASLLLLGLAGLGAGRLLALVTLLLIALWLSLTLGIARRYVRLVREGPEEALAAPDKRVVA